MHPAASESSAPRHAPLSLVKEQVAAGRPLPFNVYRPDTTLLLARGQVLHDAHQVESLFERGSLVDLSELGGTHGASGAPGGAASDPATAPPERLPTLWRESMLRVGQVLRQAGHESFGDALDEAARPVEALIRRDPDLAIFQVLRHEGNAYVQYGLTHSVHAAIVASLVAQRLGWSEPETQRAFRAALTMNVAMVELQGRLADQRSAPTPEQLAAVRRHPQEGRAMLEKSGIADTDWLIAVEQHHEERDGSGYPAGLRTPSELATLLHRADVYCAKLAPRATRDAEAADRAGREIFMQDPGHPVCAALVKEFGVYPPGCFVALASGETGVVIRRGPTVMTPIVAAMTNAYGAPLPTPVRRDTMQPLHAIVGVLQPRQMRARLDPAKLAAIAG